MKRNELISKKWTVVGMTALLSTSIFFSPIVLKAELLPLSSITITEDGKVVTDDTTEPYEEEGLEEEMDQDDDFETVGEDDDFEGTAIFELSRDELTLEVGKSYTLEYDLYPEQSVVFSSESSKIAKVDSNGKVIALARGNTVIKATAADGTTAECLLRVVSKPTKIILNKSSLIMAPGGKFTLKFSIAPIGVSKKYKTIKWNSSNNRVATVDEHGVVKAKKNGSCVITAMTLNGLTAKCKVVIGEKIGG